MFATVTWPRQFGAQIGLNAASGQSVEALGCKRRSAQNNPVLIIAAVGLSFRLHGFALTSQK
jgi:hypothetical protein